MLTELPITLADGTVWLSIGQGLLIGAVCLLFGVWSARIVGLLGADSPVGEIIGVGLGSGLLVLTSWWAALISGGRSSFTPVAVGFAIAIGSAVVRRWRTRRDGASRSPDVSDDPATEPSRAGRSRDLALALVGSAVFVTAVALLYGATMAPSPRDGVQPLEFMDEAYYAVLGADLARTGTESLFAPSGFNDLPGLPIQTWYHWGEAWLASIPILLLETEPLDARHLFVLPILLLTAAALTGTLVRRMTRSASRGLFLFGFVACLFLAPAPLAVGMVFEIRMYGIAAVAVLLGLYVLATVRERDAAWPLAIFAGSTAALILPAHIVIAALALVGLASVWALRIGRSLLSTRRLPIVPAVWQRIWLVSAIALVATVGWGVLTGYGLGGSALSTTVVPFNDFWRETVAVVLVCSGTMLAILATWFAVRKEDPIQAGLYVGTVALVVTGTLIWGARLGDFNTFHLFYGALAVFAAPAAAVAIASLWLRLRTTGRRGLSIVLVVLCGIQLEAGALFGIGRLQLFGGADHVPAPLTILAAIEDLPPDARLAYACSPFEEVAFWDSQLLGIDAHTGRRVVPMCFQAETFGAMTGTPTSISVESPLFAAAPQRALYPTWDARPSPDAVLAFLKAHAIDYIYVDRRHPNTLVPGAVPIATEGDTQVLAIP